MGNPGYCHWQFQTTFRPFPPLTLKVLSTSVMKSPCLLTNEWCSCIWHLTATHPFPHPFVQKRIRSHRPIPPPTWKSPIQLCINDLGSDGLLYQRLSLFRMCCWWIIWDVMILNYYPKWWELASRPISRICFIQFSINLHIQPSIQHS